ncbi:MAG: hypothetical protein M3167_00745 [Acidobacteriota bacterium]|nr:hypothetical protein [Acidobacteriota bacterium]
MPTQRRNASRVERLIWPWLVGLLLLLPSANYQVFRGIPWDTAAQVGAISVAVPFLLSRRMRRAYRAATRETGLLGRRAVWIACCAGIVGKLVLFGFGGYEGFAAAYRSPAARPVSGAWEKSYTNPIFRFHATRIDRTLDFQRTSWNLSFFNSLRFNISPWVRGNPSRDQLPIAALWTGVIEAGTDRHLAVSYVGEGQIEVGTVRWILSREYSRVRNVVIPVAAGAHRVRIRYVFDDGYRIGATPPPGRYATLRCSWTDERGRQELLRARRAPLPWRGAAACVDGLVLLVLASTIRVHVLVLRRDWRLLALAAVLGPLVYWFPIHDAGFSRDLGFVLAATALVLAFPRNRAWRNVLLAYVAVASLTFCRRGLDPGHFQTVIYRTAGNDFLSYESFARSILDTGSLETEEKIFSNQPLSRYVNFVLHILFGDGDFLIAAVYLVALNTGILALFLRYRRKDRVGARACQTAAAVLLLALAASDPVVVLVREGASEAISWVALMFWFPLLFDSTRTRDWVLGAALVGLSVGARANQLPALLAAFGAFALRAFRARPVAAVGAGAAALGVSLLPAWHNWQYGHRLVLFTYTYALNTAVAPSALLRLGSDSVVRAALLEQLKGLFYLSGGTQFGDSIALKFVFHGLQILWLGAVVAAWVRRRWVPLEARLLLLLPLLYMAPHVFFYVTIYYPRHIISPHLVMGVATIHALGKWGRGGRQLTARTENSS